MIIFKNKKIKKLIYKYILKINYKIIKYNKGVADTPHILQRCANIYRNEQYFDNNRAPRATRMYRVQPLHTSFDSAHSDVCQIPI